MCKYINAYKRTELEAIYKYIHRLIFKTDVNKYSLNGRRGVRKFGKESYNIYKTNLRNLILQ